MADPWGEFKDAAPSGRADPWAEFSDAKPTKAPVPSKAAPAPKAWDPVGETAGTVRSAYQRLKTGVKGDMAAREAAAKQQPRVENIFSLDSPMRTARAVGDAVNLAVSPVTGAFNAFVSAPVARAVAATGARAYARPTAESVVEGFRTGKVAPPRQLSADETAAEVQDAVNTSVSGAMPGRGSVGFSGPQIPQLGMKRAARPIPVQAPNIYATRGAEFARAGVESSVASVRGGAAAKAANALAENPVAGVRVRAQMGRQVEQAGAKASEIASGYGASRGPQIAGEEIQAGVRRFAKDRTAQPTSASAPAKQTSFAAKADKLYDDAFTPIESAENQAVARAQQDFETKAANLKQQREAQIANDQAAYQSALAEREQRRLLGVPEGPEPPPPAPPPEVAAPSQQAAVAPTNTIGALRDISGRVNGQQLSNLITDGRMKQILGALEKDGANVRFNDLRQLRTWVRNAQKDPTLRQGIAQADLQTIEGALTQDVYANAEALAGPQALAKLQRADAFYRAGSERINRALQAFDNANSGEQAYSKIIQSAGSTSSADVRRLVALKRSLAPDEWGDVAATTVSNLGKPTAGAANAVEEGGFSINTFLTNYAKLSPEGREVLFGAKGGGGAEAARLKGELDNLAKVAGYLKEVQKGANASNSGVSLQNIGTIGLLLNPKTMIPTAGGLGGAAAVGEILTNPAAVRWLARLGQANARSPAAYAATVNRLEAASKANAGLVPLLAQEKLVLQQASMPVAAPAVGEPRTQ